MRDSGRGAGSRRAAIAAALFVGFTAGACNHHGSPSSGPPRAYRMGFSWLPPRPDLALALQVADAFRPHADTALIQVSPPWAALLAGGDATTLVTNNELGLATLYRSKGIDWLVVSIDPTNGLDRSADAPDLVTAGRSLTEPAVQTLFRAYVTAMATLLQPDLLGVASETNLVRAIAPTPLYQALVQTANDAAADVATAAPSVTPFVSVQVETAWNGPGGSFVGIDTDRADFAFTAVLGLSSYPYLLGTSDPSQLPDDYYSRLVAGAPLPVLVLEGGWPSVTVGAVASSPDLQRRYLVRQAELLDATRSIAWFQISFTDLDLTAWPAGIAPFADLGLVTTALQPKAALGAWDLEFTRPLQNATAAR